MTIPTIFTARDGVVFFMWRPVPDWVVHETRRAIRHEGPEARIDTYAFQVWLEVYEQLKLAVHAANNQRKFAKGA